MGFKAKTCIVSALITIALSVPIPFMLASHFGVQCPWSLSTIIMRHTLICSVVFGVIYVVLGREV